jgi:hypothetical protein
MNSLTQRKFKRLIRLLNFYPPYFFSEKKVLDLEGHIFATLTKDVYVRRKDNI